MSCGPTDSGRTDVASMVLKFEEKRMTRNAEGEIVPQCEEKYADEHGHHVHCVLERGHEEPCEDERGHWPEKLLKK